MFPSYLTTCLVYLRPPDQENRLHSESCCHLLDEKWNVVATGSKVGNMYYLNCIDEQGTIHAATICSSGDTKEEIWHRHFGHLGMKNLQKPATDQLVNGLDYDVSKDIKFCESHVWMENITVLHFQNLLVSEPQNCLKLCTVMFVED